MFAPRRILFMSVALSLGGVAVGCDIDVPVFTRDPQSGEDARPDTTSDVADVTELAETAGASSDADTGPTPEL